MFLTNFNIFFLLFFKLEILFSQLGLRQGQCLEHGIENKDSITKKI